MEKGAGNTTSEGITYKTQSQNCHTNLFGLTAMLQGTFGLVYDGVASYDFPRIRFVSVENSPPHEFEHSSQTGEL